MNRQLHPEVKAAYRQPCVQRPDGRNTSKGIYISSELCTDSGRAIHSGKPISL